MSLSASGLVAAGRTSAQRPSIACFIILSACPEPWGGSEELWCATAKELAAAGNRVSVVKTIIAENHFRIRELREVCASIDDFHNHHEPTGAQKFSKLIPRRFREPKDPALSWLRDHIETAAPSLVVISLGESGDALDWTDLCRSIRMPYALICHKAADQNWPHDRDRARMRDAYTAAERVFFVSHHNRELTELQIGTQLDNAEIVKNPVLTSNALPLDWPAGTSKNLRLACVGRLNAREKGQDLLLKVLALKKWQQRPIEVNIFGQGPNSQSLGAASDWLGTKNIQFRGFVSDPSSIWQDHHALVLPSRAEGLPITLLEAMLCGRPAIVCAAGGTAEMVDEAITGFVANVDSINSLDNALERAWSRRSDWQAMGRLAWQKASEFVPANPGAILANKLLEMTRCQ
ncbi:MAG TPA: glycosyltransferase family 4 protein [Planktothrix sp.]|jgi:glycosyltransferase involved in cell wall biosynthesis